MGSYGWCEGLLHPCSRIRCACVAHIQGFRCGSPHFIATSARAGEFSRALCTAPFQTVTRQLDSMLGPELRKLAVPRPVYVVDAHALGERHGGTDVQPARIAVAARVLIVAEKFSGSESHDLLRLGAKGLLTCGEAREQLPRALPLVASGGFWVPRSMLSEFVDAIISNSRGRRLKVEGSRGIEPP